MKKGGRILYFSSSLARTMPRSLWLKWPSKAPLYYMTGTNLMDYKGRPMSVIGSYEQDPEGNLVMHITEHLNFGTTFLGIAIRKMREVGLMTTDRIMSDIIEPCPLYEGYSYGNPTGTGFSFW